MKNTKSFVLKALMIAIALLIVGGISAFASGTTEAAQDVLDILCGIEQATTPSGARFAAPDRNV
jgi:hypothetical protein